MESCFTKKSPGSTTGISKSAKRSPNPSVSSTTTTASVTTKKGTKKPVLPPKPKLPSSTSSPQQKKPIKEGSKKVPISSPSTKTEPIDSPRLSTKVTNTSFMKSKSKAPKLQKSYSISGSPRTSLHQGDEGHPRTPESSASKRQSTPTPSASNPAKLSRANSIDLKKLQSTTSSWSVSNNNKLVSLANCREVSFAMPEISQIIRRPPSSQSEGELNSRSGEFPEFNSYNNSNNRETDQNLSLPIADKPRENQSISQRVQKSTEPLTSISTVGTTTGDDTSHRITNKTDNINFIENVLDQPLRARAVYAPNQTKVTLNQSASNNLNSSFSASSLSHREQEQQHINLSVSSRVTEPYDRRTCDVPRTTVSTRCYQLNSSQISLQTQSAVLAPSSCTSSARAPIGGLDHPLNYDNFSEQQQEQFDPVPSKGSSGQLLSSIKGRMIQQPSNKNRNTLRSSVSQDSPFQPSEFSAAIGGLEDPNWNDGPVAYHYNNPNAYSSYGKMHSSRSYECCNETSVTTNPPQQHRLSPNFYFHNHLVAQQQHQKRYDLYQHHPMGGSLQFYPTTSTATPSSTIHPNNNNNNNNISSRSTTTQKRRGRFVKSQSLGSASTGHSLNTINENPLGRQHYSSTVTVNQDYDDDVDNDEDGEDDDENNRTNQSGRQPRRPRQRRRHTRVPTEKYYFGWWRWESETLNRLIHQRNLRDAAKQCCLESRVSPSALFSSTSLAHVVKREKLPKKEEFTEWDNRTGTLTFNTFKPDASRTSLDSMKIGIGIDHHEVMNGNSHSNSARTPITKRGGHDKTDTNYYSTNIHDIILNERNHSEFASQMTSIQNQNGQRASTSTSATTSEASHQQQQQPPWYHTAGSQFESYNSLNNNTHSSFQTSTSSPPPPPLPTCQPPPLSSSEDINRDDKTDDDPKINRVHQYRNVVVGGSRPSSLMSAANSLPAISAAANNPNPADIEYYNSVQLTKNPKFHHSSSGGAAAHAYYEPIMNINLLEGESRVGFSMTGGVGESLPSLVNQIIKGYPNF